MERLLYEYDYQKPELTDDFLEHHGIIGMKWGQKNGPPYPLSSKISTGKRLRSTVGGIKKKLPKSKKQKQKEERERYSKMSKEEIINTKNVKAMNQRSSEFTDQEINKVLNRLNTEDRLSKIALDNKPSRTKKVIDHLKKNSFIYTVGISALITIPIAIARARQGVVPGYDYAARVAANLPKEYEAIFKKVFKEGKKATKIVNQLNL